ncbi:MAG: SEL1-like repeat protein, partial [Synergistaceae bacterium]|nr:SEL1-like repeat protein [Synergistaceae bacterium]
YRQAAEQGLAKAQYNLGMMYEFGDGVKQNRNKAIELYRKAARQGHEMAKQRLKKLGAK